jgi:hypothetical protein
VKYFVTVWLIIVAAFAFAGVGAAGETPTVASFTSEQLQESFYAEGDQAPSTRTGVQLTPAATKSVVAELNAAYPAGSIYVEGSSPFPSRPRRAGGAYTASETADICWRRSDLNYSQGLYPQNRGVTEDRLWCAHGRGGLQYYRSSHISTDTLFCSSSNLYQYKVGGGNGYRWTKVRSGADFSCPTGVPWLNLHDHVWQEWSCNTYGTCSREAEG